MSLCSASNKGRIAVIGLLIAFAVSLLSSPAVAQSEPTPTWDIFVGYQWLHPGGEVPTPGSDFNNPSPYHVPDMSKGLGASATYNFNAHWGLEGDIGHNWLGSSRRDPGDVYESTFSTGPR